ILDPEADEHVRAQMCEALALVTLRGNLPCAEAEAFLRKCYADMKPRDYCFVWDGWQAAISLLGLAELKPLVESAFQRGYIDPGWLEFGDFEEDLQAAIDGSPSHAERLERDYSP